MSSELVPITFQKIMQSRSYTVIILGTEKKKFAIYTDPHVGHNIQVHLTQGHPPRPPTNQLIDAIFRGLDIKILQVVITDVEDTIYFARLFLEQKQGDERHILEIDARPSDCVSLALIHNTPIFCRKEIFDKVVPIEE